MAITSTRALKDEDLYERIVDLLTKNDVTGVVISGASQIDQLQEVESSSVPYQIALVDAAMLSDSEMTDFFNICEHLKLPALALIRNSTADIVDYRSDLADIVICPPSSPELVWRVRRALHRNRRRFAAEESVIRQGNLVINPDSYEVTLSGQKVNLRFKEYELLLLISSNPGRVYSREALLSQVWGYDYFGGTRTVDVHIRRLRSKIEDAEHSFIETIWNVGYRFKAPNIVR